MANDAPTVPTDVDEVVARALAEDVRTGDVTARLLPAEAVGEAMVVAREAAVICGRPWFDAVFAALDPAIEIAWEVEEGGSVKQDQAVVRLKGSLRPLLTGERTALNFLQGLSGCATQTRRFVERVRGTPAKIVDTRKTQPGLRSAQKYAVLCGGGVNHRMGLYDAILIKENHIIGAGGITAAIRAAKALDAGVPLMCEAENLSELQAALDEKVDLVLIDDFPIHVLNKAMALARDYRRFNRAHSLIEASGGITMNNVRTIADTGVDRISIGSLTKNVQAVDLSLRVAGGQQAEAAPGLRAVLK